MNPITTPEWLEPIPTAQPSTPNTSVTFSEPVAANTRELALLELQYQAAFEPLIDRVQLGHSVKDILSDRPQESFIHQGAFMRWIKKDPERLARFRTAQEDGAEVVEDEMTSIADGHGTLEDVARSTLRINTRKWVLEVRNKKRYAKDAMPSNPFASGSITINIGGVDVPDRNNPSLPNADVIDV